MVNIPVITRRELNTYFLSPGAYVVLFGFAVIQGVLFVSDVDVTIEPNIVASSAFGAALLLLIFACPIITMRLLSEEAGSGTIETLLTTPVTDAEVVLGKYVGALIFSMVMMVPLVLEVGFLAALGSLDYGPVAAAFLGTYLLAAQFLAIGLFCSSLTRVQIGSAIMSFVVLMGLFFLWRVARDSASTAAKVLQYISPPWHMVGFLKGVIDTRDLVYFVASTALFLFLSAKVLESRRWR